MEPVGAISIMSWSISSGALPLELHPVDSFKYRPAHPKANAFSHNRNQAPFPHHSRHEYSPRHDRSKSISSSWSMSLKSNQSIQPSNLGFGVGPGHTPRHQRVSKEALATPGLILRASKASQVHDTKRRLSLTQEEVEKESRRAHIRRYSAPDMMSADMDGELDVMSADSSKEPQHRREYFPEQRLTYAYRQRAFHELNQMADMVSRKRRSRIGISQLDTKALLRKFASKYLQSIGIFPSSKQIDRVCERYTIEKFEKKFGHFSGTEALNLPDIPGAKPIKWPGEAARVRSEMNNMFTEMAMRNRERQRKKSLKRAQPVLAENSVDGPRPIRPSRSNMKKGSMQPHHRIANVSKHDIVPIPEFNTNVSIDEAHEALLEAKHNLASHDNGLAPSNRMRMVNRELKTHALACIVVLLFHLCAYRLRNPPATQHESTNKRKTKDDTLLLSISKTYFLGVADLSWSRKHPSRARLWCRLWLMPSFVRCIVEALETLFKTRLTISIPERLEFEISGAIAEFANVTNTTNTMDTNTSQATLSIGDTCLFFVQQMRDKVHRDAAVQEPQF